VEPGGAQSLAFQHFLHLELDFFDQHLYCKPMYPLLLICIKKVFELELQLLSLNLIELFIFPYLHFTRFDFLRIDRPFLLDQFFHDNVSLE
jgi:hypothetical protein